MKKRLSDSGGRHMSKRCVLLFSTQEDYNSIRTVIHAKGKIHTYWYHQHKEGVHKRNLENQKLFYNIKKDASCALCGYSKYIEALTFHHIIPEDKKYRIDVGYINKKDFAEELQKCVCLCANCHNHITKVEKGAIKNGIHIS